MDFPAAAANTFNTMQNKSPIAILGVPFDNITLAETCSLAATMIESRYPHYATTVGANFWSRRRGTWSCGGFCSTRI